MGLDQQFLARRAKELGAQVVDIPGRRRASFPVNILGKGEQRFTAEHEIMRGDLCRLLYGATKDRTKYIFGTRIKRYERKTTPSRWYSQMAGQTLSICWSAQTAKNHFPPLAGAGRRRIRRNLILGNRRAPYHDTKTSSRQGTGLPWWFSGLEAASQC
jgi:hypothetical protein